MANYGLEVSQRSDTRFTPPANLLYSSKYQSPKVNKQLHGSFTTPARVVYNPDGPANQDADDPGKAHTSVDVLHGLPYSPALYGYALWPDGKWRQMAAGGINVSTSPSKVIISARAVPELTKFSYDLFVFSDPAQVI